MSAIIGEPIVSVEFEVYGHVQGFRKKMMRLMNWYKNFCLIVLGVYFTKYCKEYSEQLGLKGWVKNSKKGTIVGKIQGYKTNVDTMWVFVLISIFSVFF